MNTDALIDTLAGQVKPVRRHAAGRRLFVGLTAGAVVTMVLVGALLGFRGDLRLAVHGFSFWMKWAYTISLGLGAVVATARLARPEPARLRTFWPISLPFVLLAFISVAQVAHAPPDDWLAMWLGRSWAICPLLVLMLSMPIFAGLLWAFRLLAPTQLRAAGAAAGLAAGAWAAAIYCLHCPEVSGLFVLTWYTLGIGIAAILGSLLGPRLLRW